MDDITDKTISDREALIFHSHDKPGKLEINPTKPMATQRDLSLAYSPGVAVPVKEIAKDPSKSYDYTTRGNMVAVISNGTAILGIGNLGALASKPVMEGKAVLFKRFADVDSIDLEVNTEDPDTFINAVRYLEPSFGGINLEDIKAPECFIIEQRLRELMDIPVFHDDQHGTAIICVAGFINALHITHRDIKTTKIVVNGAGAAGIACLELLKATGLPSTNAILCDTKGVIYKGRKEGMNQWKSAHASTTDARTLTEALIGADVFIGLSVQGILTPDMLENMAKDPIIFAMANPNPEITPEEARAIRTDAVIATGRSDYPNQVNNVLGFPYMFRGALDVRATTINHEMKIACAQALALLAREEVPDEVTVAYGGERMRFGRNYIIPVPFDPRLISTIPPAVAQAAMDSGVAQKPIVDMDVYRQRLSARLDPTAGSLQTIFNKVRLKPKRMIFAEGEQEQVIRTAFAYKDSGLGEPMLIGSKEIILANMENIGINTQTELQIFDTKNSDKLDIYTNYLYKRLQRQGYLYHDVSRMVQNDRNFFGACMLALGDADAMITGVTRNYSATLEQITKVIDPIKNQRIIGMSMVVLRGRTVLVADTNVHDMPNGEELADITEQAANTARALGYEPRVALLAYSTFGQPEGNRSVYVRKAIGILKSRKVDFEFDGEMSVEIALNKKARALYPFTDLTENANVLIMPAIHSASISTKMLAELGGATIIGPILVGLSKPIQIVRIGCTASELLNMSAIAAYNF